jgi:hypothetical protein
MEVLTALLPRDKSMKTNLTLAALVIATTLIFCGGCTDPETIAKHSADETPEVDRAAAPRDIAEDTKDRSPAADRDADSSESATRPESNKFSRSDSPRAGDRDGRENSDPEETHTAAGRDAASSDSDSNSKKTTSAKKEYKFEFVSSSGKDGLEPGDTIPEISGRDLDNIKFNLSDYEGKVVMLDFWGDW